MPMPHEGRSDSGTVIAALRRRLETLNSDTIVAETLSRHCDDLARLAENLRKLGMDDSDIEGHVVGIFRQYERALIEGILDREPARLEDSGS